VLRVETASHLSSGVYNCEVLSRYLKTLQTPELYEQSNRNLPERATKQQINLLNPTGYVMHQQVQHSTTVRSAHTVFMCFVFI